MARKKARAEVAVNVLVTVNADHRDKLEAVAEQLESAGMNIAEKFRLGGVIAGEVPRRKIGDLRAMEEISAVEEEPAFKADR